MARPAPLDYPCWPSSRESMEFASVPSDEMWKSLALIHAHFHSTTTLFLHQRNSGFLAKFTIGGGPSDVGYGNGTAPPCCCFGEYLVGTACP